MEAQPPPAPLELIQGHVYRGKKTRPVGIINTVYDDRSILRDLGPKIQYDSPSLANGRRYPVVTREKFLQWALKDVTEEAPPGDWIPYLTPTKP